MSSPPQMPTAVHYGADDRHAPQPQLAPAPPDQIGRTGTTPRTSSSPPPPPQNALPNPYSLDGPPPRECLHLHRASESSRPQGVTLCRRARRRVSSSALFVLTSCYLRTIPGPDVSPKYQPCPSRRAASAVLPDPRTFSLIPAPAHSVFQLRIPCIWTPFDERQLRRSAANEREPASLLSSAWPIP